MIFKHKTREISKHYRFERNLVYFVELSDFIYIYIEILNPSRFLEEESPQSHEKKPLFKVRNSHFLWEWQEEIAATQMGNGLIFHEILVVQ